MALEEPFKAKMARLASRIADALLAGNVPDPAVLMAFKALTAYHIAELKLGEEEPVGDAFRQYAARINGEEEDFTQ